MHELTWQVYPTKAPILAKRCSKCACEEYESSGCFRVNANGRNIDVWLIYKCAHCQNTWNLTVLSRVAPSSIPQDLYYAFAKNDEETAMRYACDPQFLALNKARVLSVEFAVEGELPSTDTDDVSLSIVPKHPLEETLAHVLTRHLKCSASALKRAQQNELLLVEGDMRKIKMNKPVTILLKKGCMQTLLGSKD